MNTVTSNAVAQQLDIYNKNNPAPSSIIIQQILTSYNNTGEFQPFSGYTTLAEEGRWEGFKHRDTGEFIFMTSNKLIFGTIKNDWIAKRGVIWVPFPD